MTENTDFTLTRLSEGVFLTSGEKPNPMTLGWGQIGVMWRKRVFIAPVRLSRYTNGLIRESGAFTVSVPDAGTMKKELAYCGAKSGRDVDKWAQTGLKAKSAKSVGTAVVEGCAKYYECRLIASVLLNKEDYYDAGALADWYKTDDMHELFIGEIIEEY